MNINIKNGILEAAIQMPLNVCNEIINLYDTKEKESSELTDTSKEYNNKLLREDSTLFLDDTGSELIGVVNYYLNDALVEYVNTYNILNTNGKNDPNPFKLKSIRQKIQKTPIGGGYHEWHFEDSGMNVCHRILAWTIYLNDIEEGGETEFLYQSIRCKPTAGKIVIFPANFLATHRGNPPLSNTKYILTGWYNIAQ